MNKIQTGARLLISNLWLFIAPGTFYCGNAQVDNHVQMADYDLSHPDKILILPAILREISGLTEIDSTSIACIQDENGILFIYDLKTNQIRQQFIFDGDGDYEGITRVGSVFYVLRSDGVLFEISDYQNGKPIVASYHTGIPAQDNEGLCYDQQHGRLLVACKGKIDKNRVGKNKRVIYGFDLKSKVLSAEPVIIFDLSIIRQFAINNKMGLPGKTKAAEPDIQLKISDIAIHPITGKLFALSAADYLLFVFDLHGKIEQLVKLNPVLFNKPEGTTFLENGDLLISNEGQKGKPTILIYKYKN
jgi:uncharacterized protein YjiK